MNKYLNIRFFSTVSNNTWVTNSLSDLPLKDEDKNKLIKFWEEFYQYYLSKKEPQSGTNNKASNSTLYKEEVFSLLESKKGKLTEDELRDLQITIEDLTMNFDEESIYSSTKNIIKLLIGKELECARDYLRKWGLEADDMELLSEFGQYTLEALIVHVLAIVFNPNDSQVMVRVATLVEHFEKIVRLQAKLFKCRRCKLDFSSLKAMEDGENQRKKTKLAKLYPFGAALVQFMESRKLIQYHSSLSGASVSIKKGDKYYLPTHLYAVCNFDISLLPVKLNLPMVSRPLDWTSACPEGVNPRTLSDLSGGYLSGPTGEILHRYRLLSSDNMKNFHIDIGKGGDYKALCSVMNKLQHQSFQINSQFLQYVIENQNRLVTCGHLMPEFLSTMNINEVSLLLREFYMKDGGINKKFSFSDLLSTLCKNIQRSRYEKFLIKLASALNGYDFYLPAFLDFRGRIYRCGILHFHERDLARSLLLFAKKSQFDIGTLRNIIGDIGVAACFHYKSFPSILEAGEWLTHELDMMNVGGRLPPLHRDNIIEYARDAKHPFQFMAYMYSLLNAGSKESDPSFAKEQLIVMGLLPITQDASASAFQIMSYFLLDEKMAKRTNLIRSDSYEIQDVYTFFLEELKEFLPAVLEKNLSTIVCNLLNRKIVKGIYMPLIYGKTLKSTIDDLKSHLSHYITHKECVDVAQACFYFWAKKYAGMNCLINLIRDIGWVVSARERPVFYKVPYFTTVQDYMIMDAINIYIYDRLHKKRRKVTLRVPSDKRDRRKSHIASFVNFIHQKDAYIAMKVVEKMLNMGGEIYTVHDNFITTILNSNKISKMYSEAFCEMGHPLSIISEFIYLNLIKPYNVSSSNLEDYQTKGNTDTGDCYTRIAIEALVF